MRRDLSAQLGRDVRIDNDANCFALSEAWDDEFSAYPVVMGLILGTGVGGGVIVDGKPVTGRSFITGEFGHIRLPVDALAILGRDIPLIRCGCGKPAALRTIFPAGALHGSGNTSTMNHWTRRKSLPAGSGVTRRRRRMLSAIPTCWRPVSRAC